MLMGLKGGRSAASSFLGRCLGPNHVECLGGNTLQGWAKFLQKAVYALINEDSCCYFSQQVQGSRGRNGSGTTHYDPIDRLEKILLLFPTILCSAPEVLVPKGVYSFPRTTIRNSTNWVA